MCCCSVACISAQLPSSHQHHLAPHWPKAHLEKDHLRRLTFISPHFPSDEWRTHELALPTIPPPPAHLFSLHCLFPRSHSHLAVLPCDWTLQHVTSEVRVCARLHLYTHPRCSFCIHLTTTARSLAHRRCRIWLRQSRMGCQARGVYPPLLSHSLTYALARVCVCVCVCTCVCVCVCVCATSQAHTPVNHLPTTTERALCAHASLNTI